VIVNQHLISILRVEVVMGVSLQNLHLELLQEILIVFKSSLRLHGRLIRLLLSAFLTHDDDD
jgi:hypothetical protein